MLLHDVIAVAGGFVGGMLLPAVGQVVGIVRARSDRRLNVQRGKEAEANVAVTGVMLTKTQIELFEELQDTLHKTTQRSLDTQRLLGDTLGRVDALEAELRRKRDEVRELREERDRLRASSQKHEHDIAELQTRLGDLQRQIAERNDRIAALTAEIAGATHG